MNFKQVASRLALLLFAGTIAVTANANTLSFNALCDDCAYIDPNSVLYDGLTESVSGSLEISNTAIVGGFYAFNSASEVTFTYAGSSLLNQFTASNLTQYLGGNVIAENGDITPSATPSFVFSDINFSGNFCTAQGISLLGAAVCGPPNTISLTFTNISFPGYPASFWEISTLGVAADTGYGAQLSPAASSAPEPGSLILFSLSLLGTGFFSRKRMNVKG